MLDDWQPTDTLHFEGSPPLPVKRGWPMGVGNKEKGTEHHVVYWVVIPSPKYSEETGQHMISMVPETRLQPLERKEKQDIEPTHEIMFNTYQLKEACKTNGYTLKIGAEIVITDSDGDVPREMKYPNDAYGTTDAYNDVVRKFGEIE